MTAVPGQRGTAGVEEVPEPAEEDGACLVRGLLIGVCGTDREIAEGEYGEPPPGESKLIIGHEGLGEVLEAPAGSGFEPGISLSGSCVGPIRFRARRALPASGTCAGTTSSPSAGSSVGTDTGAEHWRVEPDFALAHPAGAGRVRRPARAGVGAGQGVGSGRPDSRSARSSCVAGRWSPARARSGCWHACWACSAAMRCTSSIWRPSGPKRDLVEALGAHYHAGDAADLDVDVEVVIECTGLGAVGRSAAQQVGQRRDHVPDGDHEPRPAARRRRDRR